MEQRLTVDRFRLLIAVGSVRGATAEANGRRWSVLCGTAAGPGRLETDRGQLRQFRTLDTVARLLRDLGIARWKVDVTHLDQGQRTLVSP
ncbi:MAG: hypothetical protein R3F12_02795 [Lysobacteraceae bacterium]